MQLPQVPRRRDEVRARRRYRGTAAISAPLVIAAALAATAPADAVTHHPGAAADSRSGPAAAVHRSTIHSVGSVRPARIAAPHRAAAAQQPLPVLRPTSGGGVARSAPVAPDTRVQRDARAGGGRSTILHNFDGVDAIDNRAAAGYNVEPPDEGLGAGNGYVANFVNVTGAIYRNDGTRVAGPFYLNTFFREDPNTNTSDPRVFYDDATRRWFATILEYSFNSDFTAIVESRVDVAVSRTPDPTRRWRIYRIPASDEGHAGCPCLADYPILGVDDQNLYISTNEFTGDFSAFNGTQLYAVSKSQLVARRDNVNVVQFENLSVAGTLAYHVQPANTYGRAAAEWMMSSLDPNSTSDNRLAVWAVTHRHTVTSGKGRPNLSVRVIQSERYSFPPIAQTPPGYCSSCMEPTSGRINTDFDAMQEVQYINRSLVGALNTGVAVPGDTTDRSGVAWFVVKPSLRRGAVSRDTTVLRQGYVAAQGLYLLYPHINMTDSGAMAMTFGYGGPDTYLSAGFAVARPGAGFGLIKRAAAGTGPDNGFTGTDKYGPIGRWGDYSNGEIIPGTNKLWLATQYIPNQGTGYSNWGNRIFELKLG